VFSPAFAPNRDSTRPPLANVVRRLTDRTRSCSPSVDSAPETQ
jgi:hypothetical protein